MRLIDLVVLAISHSYQKDSIWNKWSCIVANLAKAMLGNIVSMRFFIMRILPGDPHQCVCLPYRCLSAAFALEQRQIPMSRLKRGMHAACMVRQTYILMDG